MARVIFADYVTKENEIRHNSFECAALYEEISLTPGEYTVSAELDERGEIKDSVHFSVPGTITGKPADWRGHFYVHASASRILDGTETHVRLRPGFEARRVDFEWNGEPKHTYIIAPVETPSR